MGKLILVSRFGNSTTLIFMYQTLEKSNLNEQSIALNNLLRKFDETQSCLEDDEENDSGTDEVFSKDKEMRAQALTKKSEELTA